MMKKNKNITKESLDSLEEDSDNFKKWLIVGAALLLVTMAVFLAQIQYSPQCENMTSNNTCPVCMANFTTYDVPLELPNMSLLLKDPLCNDFCYVQSQRYGCDQWVNFGLLNGECQCDLKACIITIRD